MSSKCSRLNLSSLTPTQIRTMMTRIEFEFHNPEQHLFRSNKNVVQLIGDLSASMNFSTWFTLEFFSTLLNYL